MMRASCVTPRDGTPAGRWDRGSISGRGNYCYPKGIKLASEGLDLLLYKWVLQSVPDGSAHRRSFGPGCAPPARTYVILRDTCRAAARRVSRTNQMDVAQRHGPIYTTPPALPEPVRDGIR